ncbi:MAG: DUF2089 domain-containing protein [Acidobacteriota bacterium]|jgi:hypothetical protein|nr:DUF2089 domain-containing protein [Acidobacteriota bacterium]
MLPEKCPSCQARLKVAQLTCAGCGTQVLGLYDLPPLARLSPDEQRFVVDFVKNSGSLKEMARLLKLSYPTVRNLLDSVIEKLEKESQGFKEELP